MFCRLKETHRDVCGDFCDIAGRDNNYLQAIIFAVILDIVLPIVFVLVGIQVAVIAVVSLIVAFTIDIWLGIVAIWMVPWLGLRALIVFGIFVFVLAIIGLVITVLVVLLLTRQIGICIVLAILSEIVVMGLRALPNIGWIFSLLGLVPWYLLAVGVHMLVYKGLCKDGKMVK